MCQTYTVSPSQNDGCLKVENKEGQQITTKPRISTVIYLTVIISSATCVNWLTHLFATVYSIASELRTTTRRYPHSSQCIAVHLILNY